MGKNNINLINAQKQVKIDYIGMFQVYLKVLQSAFQSDNIVLIFCWLSTNVTLVNPCDQ